MRQTIFLINFEKFVVTELISENEYSKNPAALEEYIHTQDFDNYKSSKSRTFIVVVDPLAGKSKKEVEKIIGKPNSKEVIHQKHLAPVISTITFII